MSVLTELIACAQEPPTSPSDARCVSRPALPTTWLIRSSSPTSCSLRSRTSLNASATFLKTPSSPKSSRTEKSPFLKAFRAVRSCRASKIVSVRSSIVCIKCHSRNVVVAALPGKARREGKDSNGRRREAGFSHWPKRHLPSTYWANGKIGHLVHNPLYLLFTL